MFIHWLSFLRVKNDWGDKERMVEERGMGGEAEAVGGEKTKKTMALTKNIDITTDCNLNPYTDFLRCP